jgi:type I restriction enzyme S subunit
MDQNVKPRSRIGKLTAQLCPSGVEFRTLGEVGEFIRGNGLQKRDLAESGVGAIHYGQIHTHYGTWATVTKSFASEALAAKLRKANPGDLVIATTSEDDEAVAKAVAWVGDATVVVSGDAYIYRHKLDPKYVAYFFQSEQFQEQKKPHITGTKVRRISGQSLAKIRLPIPPLEIQHEIVNVLDKFTELEAKLEAEVEAELEARRAQYLFYRDQLLTAPEAQRIPMGELATIGTGSRNTNEALEGGSYPFFVRSQEPLAIDEFEFDEPAIITAGDGVGVGKVFHFVDGKYALHQRAYRIHVTSRLVVPKYLFHFVKHDFSRYLAMISVQSSVTSLRMPMFERYPIPVPSLEEQQRIVTILDTFDSLIGDMLIELPAEIDARRKQYEYYSDRLLTFPEYVAA